MTLTNVSTGLETSAVFKEIVVQTSDLTGTAVLWSPQVLASTGVSYDWSMKNHLPGFNDDISRLLCQ